MELYVLFVASIEEQQEIVHRVESLFKIADQLEERYSRAKEYVDKLTQSILAKAFRGELVPQNPNDEPASKLLERIKAERATQTAKRTKNKKKPKTKK
jgi:type I restriction enzyme S subunit